MEYPWLKGRVVTFADIRGDLHVHTNWSDGAHSIEEMAEAAINLGYEYIAITDHYRGKCGIRGMDENRLKKQFSEIEMLNEHFKPFRILTGIEVDINPDGTLDFPEDILDKLDIVIAAIHATSGQSSEEMTLRMLTALRNPHVHILGHPTCCLSGMNVDIIRVIDEAKRYGKILEINAMPDRHDQNEFFVSRARERGVMLSMGTDAHQVEHLSLMYSGVSMARRGLCPKTQILNCLSLEELLFLLKNRV